MVMKRATPSEHPEHGLIAVIAHKQSLRVLIDDLRTAGVSQDRMAFMARDTEEETSDLLQKDGHSEGGGMVTGGVAGVLAGLGTLAIPEFGVLVLAGGPMLVGALALAGATGGVGLGAIVGAIFEEHVVKGHREIYQEHLTAGHAILVVEGTGDEITTAQEVLTGVPTLRIDVF